MKQPDEQNGLTPEEKRLFGTLPRHRIPPSSLEEKIMSKLRDQGLVVPTKQRISVPAIAAAVAFLLLGSAGGYFLGSNREESTMQSNLPKYVLLLHETPDPAEDTQAMITEYGNWARSIRGDVKYVSGEKLKMSGRILTKKGDVRISDGILTNDTMNLAGFFIIAAKDYEAAARIASDCPHLKYGGVIELREIDPT